MTQFAGTKMTNIAVNYVSIAIISLKIKERDRKKSLDGGASLK
jgi:hypothetical protein